MKTPNAPLFYVIGEAGLAFAGAMGWVILPVYYVLVARMNPFQLLLVGATFELTIFFCDVPTGAIADVSSRRGCVVAGALLGGCALILQGLVPVLSVILVGAAIDGLGASLVSGAWPAWLMDEVGEERFGPLLTRGRQVGQAGSFGGAVVGGLLATVHLQLPILVAGACSLLFAALAVVVMPEKGFVRGPRTWSARRQAVGGTLRAGVRVVRASRLVVAILAIAAVFGAFGEGIDHLSEPHLLLDIGLPPFAGLGRFAWFGVMSGGGLLLSVPAMELLRRRLNLQSRRSITRALLAVTAGVVVTALGFALAPGFVPVLSAYWVLGVLRPLADLLSIIWLNGTIRSSQVRATVLSMGSGANACGEWMGGPAVGALATLVSIPAALCASALLLSPALALYGWALRGEDEP